MASIDRTGLRPGNRMYVHLSADEQTAVTGGTASWQAGDLSGEKRGNVSERIPVLPVGQRSMAYSDGAGRVSAEIVIYMKLQD